MICKSKRIFASLLICMMITFNYEVARADLALSASFAGTFSTFSGAAAIGAEAIPVVLLATAAIATGVVVYQNADQIKAVGEYLYNQAQSAGIDLSTVIVNNTLIMTSAFKSWLGSIASSIPSTIDFSAPYTMPTFSQFPALPTTNYTQYILYTDSSGSTYYMSFNTVNNVTALYINGGNVVGSNGYSSAIVGGNIYFLNNYYHQWMSAGSVDSMGSCFSPAFSGGNILGSSISFYPLSTPTVPTYSNGANVSTNVSGALTNSPSISGNISAIPDNDVITVLPTAPLTGVTTTTLPTVLTDSSNVLDKPVTNTDYTGALSGISSLLTDIKSGIQSISNTITNQFSVPSTVPTVNFAPLEVSLSNKFPFCLPFDLVNMIQSFNVPSSPPSFTIQFPSVNLGSFGTMQGYSFVWDFGQFSTQATIVRYFILLCFVVALIKLTKTITG